MTTHSPNTNFEVQVHIPTECPYCHSKHIGAKPLSFMEKVSKFWYLFFILAYLGYRYASVLFMLSLFVGGYAYILFQKRRSSNRLATTYYCHHCQKTFLEPTASGLKLAAKDLEYERKNEARKIEKEMVKEEAIQKNNEEGFGKISNEERLIKSYPHVHYRYNAVKTTPGFLRVTDKNLIWYNFKTRITIPRAEIASLESANFYHFIKTGITIHLKDQSAHTLVIPGNTRNEVYYELKKLLKL